MTLSDLMLKVEKLLADCSQDELHMLWGMIQGRKGRDMLRQKIAKMIIYRENQESPEVQAQRIYELNEKARKSREEVEAFEKIMKGAL